MFNNTSWQSYWLFIALLSTGYYGALYLFFFRKDFLLAWRKRVQQDKESPFLSSASSHEPSPSEVVQQPFSFAGAEEFQLPLADSTAHAVYACVDEINAYLEGAKSRKCLKEEMLYALRTILRKYPALSTSEYKESLNSVLVSQCEYHCSVHLSADDMAQVWLER